MAVDGRRRDDPRRRRRPAGCVASRRPGELLGADPDARDRRHRGQPERDADPRADLARRRADRLRRGHRRRRHDPLDAGHGHDARVPEPATRAGGAGRPVVDRQRQAAAEPRRDRAGRPGVLALHASAAATTARCRGSATRARPGRPGSTRRPRAAARGSRWSRTTPPTPSGTPTRVVLQALRAARTGCEIPLEAADTYSSTSPTFSPDGTRLAFAQSDGIHVMPRRLLRVTRSSRCRARGSPTGARPTLAPPGRAHPAVPRLTLAVSTRRRPRRAARAHGPRHGQRADDGAAHGPSRHAPPRSRPRGASSTPARARSTCA